MAEASKTKGLSWRVKLSLLLLVFSVIPMLGVLMWAFATLENAVEESTLDGLSALARAKAEAIDQFTDVRRRDVERIASLLAPHLGRYLQVEKRLPDTKTSDAVAIPQLKDAEALDLSAPPDSLAATDPALADGIAEAETAAAAPPETGRLAGAQADLKQALGLILWDQRDFEELLVIDGKGEVVGSTFDGHEGKSAANLEYFQHGVKATYLQPVFMSPITEELTMVIAAPIRNENMEDLGVLAARLNLKRFFRLINDNTGLGESGETVVAKRIDENIVFMAPTRHDAEAALKRKVALGGEDARSLQEAARGQVGLGRQLDYRGVETYAAWQFVPSLEWGLLAKVDVSEALARVESARDKAIMLLCLMILLIVPASMWTARALVRPLGILKDATDRISRGDFAVQIDIQSNDEIGELADSFDRMVAAIKFFREHSRSSEEDVESEGAESFPDRS